MLKILSVYTDCSKISEWVSCGIFIKNPNIKLSSRLPAEVIAILKAAQFFLSDTIFPENLFIYSNSQVAFKFLTNVVSM